MNPYQYSVPDSYYEIYAYSYYDGSEAAWWQIEDTGWSYDGFVYDDGSIYIEVFNEFQYGIDLSDNGGALEGTWGYL